MPQQRALLPTLHMAELPETIVGDTNFFAITPPTGTANGFTSHQPFDVPVVTPYKDVRWDGTTGYMPASYGLTSVESLGVFVQDPQKDFSLLQETFQFNGSNYVAGFASPTRLGGGMCLVMRTANLNLPDNVGFYSPRGIQALSFTSQAPQGSFPPGDYQLVMRVSSVINGYGASWVSPGGFGLSVIYPATDSLFLIDNLATGTGIDVSRYVGGDTLPEINDNIIPVLQRGAIEAVWLGVMNL